MPRESQDQQEHPARAREILRILRKTYPNVKCALNFGNPLELLIATILSAQCTDERVNSVTPRLFQKYRSAADYARASLDDLANEICSLGFFRNKAKSIVACCKAIVEKHGGEVPRTMAELTALPGVGRKTANVVLGNAFGIQEGIAVDTHARRVATRLGLSRHSDPDKIEQDLMRLVPRRDWTMASHWLIWHGRLRCTARKPDCTHCELASLCPAASKNNVTPLTPSDKHQTRKQTSRCSEQHHKK
ncbi:MAG: endonuclease III [Verrucomicrobiae bacterium]|nr:endonuclease III [Verrucomicrobiae bacterium]